MRIDAVSAFETEVGYMKTNRMRFGCFLFGLLVLALLIECAGAITLNVSPGGKDGALGSLGGARDAIRKLKDKGPLKEPVRLSRRGLQSIQLLRSDP